MMARKEAVTLTANKNNGVVKVLECATKVDNSKDIDKVCAFFRYKTATTLDAAIETGILRNSITWYVSILEGLGMLQAVKRWPDTRTGRMAKYYSANPGLWHQSLRPQPIQLNLFDRNWQDE